MRIASAVIVAAVVLPGLAWGQAVAEEGVWGYLVDKTASFGIERRLNLSGVGLPESARLKGLLKQTGPESYSVIMAVAGPREREFAAEEIILLQAEIGEGFILCRLALDGTFLRAARVDGFSGAAVRDLSRAEAGPLIEAQKAFWKRYYDFMISPPTRSRTERCWGATEGAGGASWRRG